MKKGPKMDERAEESRASWWATSIPVGGLLSRYTRFLSRVSFCSNTDVENIISEEEEEED